ncbi:acyl-CoA N-acyltransferase [Phaeosphaeria sp. MPI-PUGE-AT-0046c]|nr:acyl-CoA N-acyltransferase [Phaeosphaeria sp. MPI-PUGE-AT-0046c]
MVEYSELETIYRALHSIRPRRRRWEEGPGYEPDPPLVFPERPLFSNKIPRRAPSPSIHPIPYPELIPASVRGHGYTKVQPATKDDFLTPSEIMAQALSRPCTVKQLLQEDALELDAYQLANPDLPLEFELVESASFLRDDDFEACFQLVDHTSSDDYKGSSIGWKPKQKREEMRDKEMVYLLVREPGTSTEGEKPKEIMGFLSFMFTKDDPPHEDREVVYIYEIHLADGLRGRGLGTKLIQFLEVAAVECGITKTMLTVFVSNKGARGLYEKLGYSKDACSPEDRTVRRRVIEADYIIMSKELA